MTDGKFVVAEGGSIMVRNGEMLLPGTEIKRGMLTEPQLREHLRSGYVKAVHRKAPAIDPRTFTENPPGKVDNPPVRLLAPEEGPPEKPITLHPMPTPVPAASKWTLDPDGLRGYTVEQLNVLVSQRDSSIDPFETAEEAAAFLSQDYVSPSQE